MAYDQAKALAIILSVFLVCIIAGSIYQSIQGGA